MTSSTFASLTLALGVASMVACSHSTSNAGTGNPSPANSKSTTPPNPDPRVGLRAGKMDAGVATPIEAGTQTIDASVTVTYSMS